MSNVYNPLHMSYGAKGLDRDEFACDLSPMARKCVGLNPFPTQAQQVKLGKAQATARKEDR